MQLHNCLINFLHLHYLHGAASQQPFVQTLNMVWPGKASAGEPDWLAQANKI